MSETEVKKRRVWPEELAWPAPPAGFRGFFLTLMADDPWGTPRKERHPWKQSRLNGLTAEELAWVGATVEVEIKRRPLRKSPVETGR